MKRFTLYALLLLAFNLSAQNSTGKRDSIIQLCRQKSEPDTIRADAYNNLCQVLYYASELDSSKMMAEEGLQFMLGIRHFDSEQERLVIVQEIAEMEFNLGTITYTQGELDVAAQHLYQSLKYYEYLKDEKMQADVLYNIGNLEIDNGEYDKAQKTYKRVLTIQLNLNDSLGMARTYNAFGFLNKRLDNDSLALANYEKSLELKMLLGDVVGTATSRNNIGFIYRNFGDYPAAIEQYEIAYAVYDSIGHIAGKIALLTNLANCYYAMGDLNSAKQYVDQTARLLAPLNRLEDQMYLAEISYKVHKSMGNVHKALADYEAFIMYRDSLNSHDHYKALIDQELSYTYEKKALEQQKQAQIKEIQYLSDVKIGKQKSFTLFLIVIIVGISLIILAVLLYFILKQLKITRAQKALIERQNREIEMKALRSQMNPHFLFNSLNSIKHFIVKNESDVAATYLSKFAKLVRLVLENSGQNLISLQDELDCTRYYLELERIRFDDKFDFRIEGSAHTDFVELPPLILQPFVENAIWHGFMHKEEKDGLIVIRVSDKAGVITIEIEDNGIGRVKAKELSSQNKSEKKSMGLAITYDRLAALNRLIGISSTIEVIDLYDSENNACGTKVVLILPYNE